tara:strand:+ start:360 stop:551 length:192 start_codon:yes stop_codon:yes gene_type:complete
MQYTEARKNYESWIRFHEQNGGGLRRTNTANRVEGTNRSTPSFVVKTATSEGISSFELAKKQK